MYICIIMWHVHACVHALYVCVTIRHMLCTCSHAGLSSPFTTATTTGLYATHAYDSSMLAHIQSI